MEGVGGKSLESAVEVWNDYLTIETEGRSKQDFLATKRSSTKSFNFQSIRTTYDSQSATVIYI